MAATETQRALTPRHGHNGTQRGPIPADDPAAQGQVSDRARQSGRILQAGDQARERARCVPDQEVTRCARRALTDNPRRLYTCGALVSSAPSTTSHTSIVTNASAPEIHRLVREARTREMSTPTRIPHHYDTTKQDTRNQVRERVMVKTCGWGGMSPRAAPRSRRGGPSSLRRPWPPQAKSAAVMPSGCPDGHSTNSIR
jgi:hypothetical protein